MRRFFLAASVTLPLFCATLAQAVIPTVHVTIFRFKADTQEFVGLYELNQSYRKSLPGPGYTQSTNLLVSYWSGGDFGGVDINSRLTGQHILSADWVWMGTGTFTYPPSSSMSTTLLHGYVNPAPEAIINPNIEYGTDVNAAWALVQDTDAIARLAAYDTYEVYAWQHVYGFGGGLPNPEIIIVAATHPVAPGDVGMVQVAWPRSLMTRGLAVTPEIVINNFGDSPADVQVALDVAGDTYQVTQPLTTMAMDELRTVFLPPLIPYDSAARTFNYSFLTAGGGAWSDTFSDNDIATESVRVTDQPVFRYAPWIPRDGVPCDFDADGDMDIVAFESYLHLYRNDGTGHFTDISGLSSIPSRLNPRNAICGDFNGDGRPDLFVAFWAAKGMMLRNDGAGVFTDVTTAWGLNIYTTYSSMLAVDLEKDGDLDIIVAMQGIENVLQNDGTGHFINIGESTGISDGWNTGAIVAGNLNGDDYPDLALAGSGPPSVYVNNGGTFTRIDPQSWSMTSEMDVAMFDFDGDHDDDLFFLQNVGGTSRLFRNNGDLTFTQVTPPPGGFPTEWACAAGDFNQDGRGDLLFTSGQLVMSTGSALVDTTALLIDYSKTRLGLSTAVHFADLDNDGDLDVYSVYKSFLNQGVRPIATGSEKPVVVATMLEQNFPNPFNPTTTIRYRVATSGHVTLAIYNVAGQRVRTLVDQTMRAGAPMREAVWDGRDNRGAPVASGVYLYRLTAPGFNQTRKLVLLK